MTFSPSITIPNITHTTGDKVKITPDLMAPILFIDSDPENYYEVINLYFSDGTTVKVISEHAFWDINLNKYVYLRSDAAQYRQAGHQKASSALSKLSEGDKWWDNLYKNPYLYILRH